MWEISISVQSGLSTRYAEEFCLSPYKFSLFSQIAYRSVSELSFPDLISLTRPFLLSV